MGEEPSFLIRVIFNNPLPLFLFMRLVSIPTQPSSITSLYAIELVFKFNDAFLASSTKTPDSLILLLTEFYTNYVHGL